MSHTRTIDGPVGLVGAGYIGHLFAQQFAIAGYDVRAWSPGESAATLSDRLRQSLSTLAEIGAVEPSPGTMPWPGSLRTTTSVRR